MAESDYCWVWGYQRQDLLDKLIAAGSEANSVKSKVDVLDVIFHFLRQDVGIPYENLIPLRDTIWEMVDDAVLDLSEGRPPMATKELYILCWAAAAVTALVKRNWSLAEAIKAVAKEAGLDETELKNFRYRVGRGRLPSATDDYEDNLATFDRLYADDPSELILKVIRTACT
jgi:hypothetical protein